MEDVSFLNPSLVIRRALIHEGMKVADFGCGSGFFTRAAARAVGTYGVVWAIDAHKDMLTHIRSLAKAEGLHNIQFVTADLEEHQGSSLPDAAMDVVLVCNMLFAAENKNALVAEAFRVLRAGGRVIAVDWKDSFGGLGPHPDHVMSQMQARSFFERGGFTYVEDMAAGYYHWGCVFRKASK